MQHFNGLLSFSKAKQMEWNAREWFIFNFVSVNMETVQFLRRCKCVLDSQLTNNNEVNLNARK